MQNIQCSKRLKPEAQTLLTRHFYFAHKNTSLRVDHHTRAAHTKICMFFFSFLSFFAIQLDVLQNKGKHIKKNKFGEMRLFRYLQKYIDTSTLELVDSFSCTTMKETKVQQVIIALLLCNKHCGCSLYSCLYSCVPVEFDNH